MTKPYVELTFDDGRPPIMLPLILYEAWADKANLAMELAADAFDIEPPKADTHVALYDVARRIEALAGAEKDAAGLALALECVALVHVFCEMVDTAETLFALNEDAMGAWVERRCEEWRQAARQEAARD
jgi:hypothetical protein